ncbi:recombinase family protein, partial [Novipirellula rosea]|uniref:recombinase family protein n=1 Tax=Novipirellula rosea TaxID=1031540 RepID=UPI0031ECFEF7
MSESITSLFRLTVVYSRQSRYGGGSFSSCDAQYAICSDTASSLGLPVHDHFADEGESSETLDRPAMQELLNAVKEDLIDRVIVYKVDRLVKPLALLAKLLAIFEEHEVNLVVVTDPNFGQSAASRLASNIVAAASEFQQDLTRDRLAEMRMALKHHGKRVAGQIPVGYMTEDGSSKLVPHPEHSVIIRDMFAMAARGAKPGYIVSIANLSDWPDRYGNTGRWTTTRVLKLLSNRTYLGEIPNGDSTLPGEHEAIVKQDVFDRVQQHISERRTRKPGRRENPHEFLLRGILVCGLCERPMTTSYSHHRNIRYLYYRCRSQAGGRPPCASVSVKRHDIEQFVIDTLGEPESDDPDFMEGLRKVWQQLDQDERRRLLPRLLRRVI